MIRTQESGELDLILQNVIDPTGRIKEGMLLRWVEDGPDFLVTMCCLGLCAPTGMYSRKITDDDLSGKNGKITQLCAEITVQNGGDDIPCDDNDPNGYLDVNRLRVKIEYMATGRQTTCFYKDIQEV